MAMKIIRDEVMRTGGTEKVTITHELLVKCPKARAALFQCSEEGTGRKKKERKVTEIQQE